MAKTVFLSYASDDRAVVEQLHQDLIDGGIEPYYDQQLQIGQKWWDELMEHVEGCDLFMPVLSAAYVDSVPCSREAEHAEALNKHFVPVLVVESISRTLLMPSIAQTQWVTYRPGEVRGALRLVAAVTGAEVSSNRPGPRPVRPAAPVTYLIEWRDRLESSEDIPRSEQAELVVQLGSRFRGREADDVRRLLERFRARPDLFEKTARDLDALLASGPGDATATVTADHSYVPPPPRGWSPPPPPEGWHHESVTTSPPTGATPSPDRSPTPVPPGASGPAATQPPSGHQRGHAGAAASDAGPRAPDRGGPPDHQGFALAVLITTGVCCLLVVGLFGLPFAILGFVNSRKVRDLTASHDLAGAKAASRRSLVWPILALILTLAAFVVFGIIGAHTSSGSS